MRKTKHNEANQLTIKKYINFLYEKDLSFIETLDFEVLMFFCSYLVTTPESKYTFSYYNNKVDLFKPFLINFKKKLDLYVVVFYHLDKFCINYNIPKKDRYLVFDESIIFHLDRTSPYELTDNSNISKISSKGVILQFIMKENKKIIIDYTCKISQKMIETNAYTKRIEDDFLFFSELKK